MKNSYKNTKLIQQIQEDLDTNNASLNPAIIKMRHREKKPYLMFYVNQFLVGGVERVVSTVLLDLAHYYNIGLITLGYNGNNSYPLPGNINVLSFKEESQKRIVDNVVNLCKIFDIDIFIGLQNMVIETLLIYDRLNAIGIKTISSNHCDFLFVTHSIDWSNIMEKRDSAYKKNFCSIWKNSRSALIADKLYGNAFYIPNPLPFVKRNKVSVFGTEVLALGRMDDPLKRIELSLLIMNQVHQMNNDIHFTIVGDINPDIVYPVLDNRKVLQYVSDNELNDCISFVDTTKDVDKYYSNADVLMITSATEGFGMTIIEAFSFGVPVVAFDVSSLSDLIECGSNGYLVPNKDTDLYAARLLNILTDESLQCKLKIGALKSASKYSSNNIVDMWKALIDAALASDNKKLDSLKPQSSFDLYLKNIISEYEESFIKNAFIIKRQEKEICALTQVIQDLKKDNRSKLQKLVDFSCTRGFCQTMKRIFFGKNA